MTVETKDRSEMLTGEDGWEPVVGFNYVAKTSPKIVRAQLEAN